MAVTKVNRDKQDPNNDPIGTSARIRIVGNQDKDIIVDLVSDVIDPESLRIVFPGTNNVTSWYRVKKGDLNKNLEILSAAPNTMAFTADVFANWASGDIRILQDEVCYPTYSTTDWTQKRGGTRDRYYPGYKMNADNDVIYIEVQPSSGASGKLTIYYQPAL